MDRTRDDPSSITANLVVIRSSIRVIGRNVPTITSSLKIWRVMVLEGAWLLNESWDSYSLIRDA